MLNIQYIKGPIKNRSFIKVNYIEFPIRIRGFPTHLHTYMCECVNLSKPQAGPRYIKIVRDADVVGDIVEKTTYSNRKFDIIDLNRWLI